MTALLQKLIDATPPPPDGEDVEVLLATFEQVHAARAHVMTTDATVGPFDPVLRAKLVARDAEWHAALAKARDAVGAARIGTSRMRRYG